MKKYLENIKSKPPHERRIHAMQLSVGIVAVVFVAWMATLGVRLTAQSPQVANNLQADGSEQSAAAVQSADGNATLYVSTTTGN